MMTSLAYRKRGVQELLHFTTNRGVLGILASRAIKARARLARDAQLEKIFFPNAADRSRDAAWHDYVNLSISEINSKFFSISSKSWHRGRDFWWAIIAVNPEVMTHEGVYFATTNNMYSGVAHGQGVAGFEALFAPRVFQWAGNPVDRSVGRSDSLPTCGQAEVLYPGEISTGYIKGIYVYDEAACDEVAGQMAAVGHDEIPILVRPELFGEIK